MVVKVGGVCAKGGHWVWTEGLLQSGGGWWVHRERIAEREIGRTRIAVRQLRIDGIVILAFVVGGIELSDSIQSSWSLVPALVFHERRSCPSARHGAVDWRGLA